MTKQYQIRHGFSFVDDKNAVHTGGAVIELADDVAQLHLHKLEALPATTSKRATPKTQKPTASDTSALEPAPVLGVASDEPESAQDDPAPATGASE
jgi:hypothetical protein